MIKRNSLTGYQKAILSVEDLSINQTIIVKEHKNLFHLNN